jgi:hypothetical protein
MKIMRFLFFIFNFSQDVASEAFVMRNQILFSSTTSPKHNIFLPFIIINKFMNSNKFCRATKKYRFYTLFSAEDTDNAEASTCGKILIFLSWVLVFLTMPISLLVCFKVSYINVICCLTSMKVQTSVSHC